MKANRKDGYIWVVGDWNDVWCLEAKMDQWNRGRLPAGGWGVAGGYNVMW